MTSRALGAHTALYGIFGNPVRHSLSPALHNAAFAQAGLDAVYLAFEVPQGLLGSAFEAMRGMGMAGANVTIPFKEEAIEFVDEIPEDLDRCIGAINTVVNRGGTLYGYNTDGPGLLLALQEELNFSAEGKSVMILGSGGAARGAAFALARAGARGIYLLNRTKERAEGLAETMDVHFPETDIEPLGSLADVKGEKVDLVLNATSLGLKKGDPSPIDLGQIAGKPAVYDMIYSGQTALLADASKRGLVHAGGLGMLVNQAAIAFKHWTGQIDGVREVMSKAVRETAKAKV